MRKLWVGGLLVLLSGCTALTNEFDGVFRDRSGEYLRASLVEPLEVPQDLSFYHYSDKYPVPKRIPQEDIEVDIVPPEFYDVGA